MLVGLVLLLGLGLFPHEPLRRLAEIRLQEAMGAGSRLGGLRVTPFLLRVEVRDHGVGLNAETLDAVFQPFYTTKPDGLGVGLSISRTIIQQHRGCLWAENNPDGGATFHFSLPPADRPTASADGSGAVLADRGPP